MRVDNYKLRESQTGFEPLGLLGPIGNSGSVGSVVPLGVTFGREPQALAQMFTLDQLCEPLLDHLRVSRKPSERRGERCERSCCLHACVCQPGSACSWQRIRSA